jgi:glycosyltransferase involved in cell wall biosynthesis
MRILFFSHYFPPEVNAPANRTYEHCRAWVAAGHEVHVVTCVPSHPAGKPYAKYRSGWYHREQIDGIHVHRVWTHLAPNRGVLRRTLNYLSFVPTAVFRALRLGRFDVILGTSPQFFCAVAAWMSAAAKRTPWIFELRDLWPESIGAVGAIRTNVVLRLLERLELRMYHSAARVVCLTRAFMSNLAGRGVNAQKLAYVPNGISPSFWNSGSRRAGRERLGIEDQEIAVAYVGTVGMAHGLGSVLDAAQQLAASEPRIRFFVVGDGAELPELKRRAASLGLTNVTFTGLRPRDEIADVMAAIDIALVTLMPSDTFKTVLPSKMFEAMAAGKPIVLAVEGEARDVLTGAGGGLCVEPGNSGALAQAIVSLAADASLRQQLGAAGATYVQCEFDRRVWANRFAQILATVPASGTAATAGTVLADAHPRLAEAPKP